jgi:hypothetical protein
MLDALGAMWQVTCAQLSGVPRVSFDLQPGRSSSCGTIECDTAPIIVLKLKNASSRNLPARDILFLLLVHWWPQLCRVTTRERADPVLPCNLVAKAAT